MVLKGYLLGVFDGHGGPACARVLAKRLLSYIAASLPSQHVSSLLLEQMTPTTEFRPEIESLYAYEFNQYHASVSYLRDTLSNDESQCSINSTERALVTAFDAMDQQLSEEALAFLLGPEMGDILQRVPRWDWYRNCLDLISKKSRFNDLIIGNLGGEMPFPVETKFFSLALYRQR